MSTVEAVAALKTVLDDYDQGIARLASIIPVARECVLAVREHDPKLAGELESLVTNLQVHVACKNFGYVSDTETIELVTEARSIADASAGVARCAMVMALREAASCN